MKLARSFASALLALSLTAGSALAAPEVPPSDPVLAQPVAAEELLEQTEDFMAQRAEVQFTDYGSRMAREISIGGLRVNDLQLAQAVGDEALVRKLEAELNGARFWQGALSVVTIPAGGYMLFLANQRMSFAKANNQADFLAFVLGAAGGIVAIFGVTNLVPLMNDVAGVSSPKLLSNQEVSELIKAYNGQLKLKLLRESLGGTVPIARGDAPLASWSFKF